MLESLFCDCDFILCHNNRKTLKKQKFVFVFCEQCDSSADWRVNGAGFHHSHQHGFGLLNAWRLVNAAKVGGSTHTSIANHLCF